MTSQSKPPGWRRLNKTHGTFEAIPSFRVNGKDLPSGGSSPPSRKPPTPKKPAQYADQTLFPGRRLDRRQPSSYSGVSDHSGISGLDQLTLHSSGKFRAAGSTAGSTKLSHASLPSLNRPFLPDSSSDPWGSARQIAREDSPLTMLRRQVAEAEEENKLQSITGHQAPCSISKVSRWQQANFLPGNRPVSFETREPLLESPDSMESHESELEPPVDHELLHQRELRRQEQREREQLQQDLRKQNRGRLTPPLLKVSASLPTQQPRGLRHVNPHRRPANTPAVSPSQPNGLGPKLNKILWALAPDEHANASDAAVSNKQPSCRETSATDDKANTGRFETLTDLYAGSDKSCHVSDTSPNRHLTEQLLSSHNESASWSRDDRIFQWLSECDQETSSQFLPTHLPDIKYTFKYLKSTT